MTFTITPTEQKTIDEALKLARANVIPWSVLASITVATDGVMTLGDRQPDHKRPSSINVYLSDGVRAALAFEDQPAGIFKHVSVSVDDQRRPPPFMVLLAVYEAFGFRHIPPKQGRVWIEEFRPGWYCINMIELEMN